MYRRQASLGAIQGVLSGPYAGGPRAVDAGRLPRAAKVRLADALAARAEPAPLLYERTGRAAGSGPVWVVAAALSALVALTAAGFAHPTSPWALQPSWTVGAYAVAIAAAVLGVLSLVRRRARLGGAALLPGRYLLPLDVVFVPPADRAGRQVLEIWPMGDAREAAVVGQGRRASLSLRFEGGREVSFPLRADPDGDLALRRLEHAQRLLEDLTYGRELEKAVAHDVFFDLRADESWEAAAPSGAVRPVLGWIHRPGATVTATALSLVLAVGALAGRNRLSDRALFLRALRAGTPEAFELYLSRGRAYRAEAEALRERLVAQRNEPRTPREAPRPEWTLDASEAATRRQTSSDCLSALRAHASPAHPEVVGIAAALVERAVRTGDAKVPVRFTRTSARLPEELTEADLEAREVRLVWAFERVFSETCPAGILRFAWAPPGGGALERGLDVRYEVSIAGDAWRVTPNPERFACGDVPAERSCPPGGRLAVYPLRFSFEVALRSGEGVASKFLLSMPPAAEPSQSVRPRSLFVLGGAAAPAGTFDERAYGAQTARAFDRLYDEIHALFFAGDPRVPLREQAEAPPFGAPPGPSP